MQRSAPTHGRMEFLDLTKGCLVLLMVVYHSFNYSNQYFLGFRYLSFLPASFIFITGFMVSLVYQPRYASAKKGTSSRLVVRGIKLITLFTVLNLVARAALANRGDRTGAIRDFFANTPEVYVYGSSRAAAFSVLLPIGYLLLLSPFGLSLLCRRRSLGVGLGLALVLIVGTFDLGGVSIGHLNLVSVGVLGLVLGQIKRLSMTFFRQYWLGWLFAYLAFFPIGIRYGYIYFVQAGGAVVAVAMLFGISLRWARDDWLHCRIARLGQYSLIAYVLQIAVLQVGSRFISRPAPGSVNFWLMLVGTTLAMGIAIEATSWARSRSNWVDRGYRSIFS